MRLPKKKMFLFFYPTSIRINMFVHTVIGLSFLPCMLALGSGLQKTHFLLPFHVQYIHAMVCWFMLLFVMVLWESLMPIA